MSKDKTTNSKAKRNYGKGFKVFFATIFTVVILISAGYCAFVTVVLADGRQNLVLAAPTIAAICATIFLAIFVAVRSNTK